MEYTWHQTSGDIADPPIQQSQCQWQVLISLFSIYETPRSKAGDLVIIKDPEQYGAYMTLIRRYMDKYIDNETENKLLSRLSETFSLTLFFALFNMLFRILDTAHSLVRLEKIIYCIKTVNVYNILVLQMRGHPQHHTSCCYVAGDLRMSKPLS